MTIKIAIILGALVGAALGGYTVFSRKKKAEAIAKKEHPLSATNLLKEQMVVASLGLQEVVDYIDQKKDGERSDRLSYIVGRVTKSTASMFCSDKENIGDLACGKYYFIEAYKENYIPVWVKLINCCAISDELGDLLAEDDFAVLTE